MQNQAYTFIIFILNGFLIGILFDLFRILRKSFKTPDFITVLEDFLFWILTGLSLLFSIFKFNNGELRVYIFLGIVIGTFIYMLLFSRIFIKVSVKLIQLIKKVFYIIIIIPIKFIINIIHKIIFKPLKFIFVKIKKLVSKIKMNITKLYKIKKQKTKKSKISIF